MTEDEEAIKIVFDKWFEAQDGFEFFTRESRAMMFNTFIAGWQARGMFEDQRVDPAKVKALHDKLRVALVASPRWHELLESGPLLSLAELAAIPPVQVDEWDLAACRAVWDWLRGEGDEVPAPLASEVARFRP